MEGMGRGRGRGVGERDREINKPSNCRSNWFFDMFRKPPVIFLFKVTNR